MTATRPSPPSRHGFRMPAEFARHAGCWMLWPERPDNWRLGGKPAQSAFVEVATAISASEVVRVGVSARQYANARARLPAKVRVVEISSNDAWMRDVGPTVVVDAAGRRRGIDWRFNAWGGFEGGLYSPWDLDDAVAAKVCEVEGFDRYRADFVMEGGAIHVDGQGTVLVTEQCLLNPNRNPSLSRETVETRLRDWLGVESVVWLGEGVFLDETDGHIDNLACFTAPGEVALTWTDDRRDPMYAVVRDAEARLAAARDARGRRFKVHKLVQPGPLRMTAAEAAGIDACEGTQPREAGARLAASYVNFYIANRHIVMPLLDRKRDAAAAAVLKRCFPTREVVGVPAREILLGGGNIHCITQQIPAGS